jgi:alpha/beta superfamily hydrolase
MFCFDFAGCGLSEGEFISLGWWEREDVAMVVEHLRE